MLAIDFAELGRAAKRGTAEVARAGILARLRRTARAKNFDESISLRPFNSSMLRASTRARS